ncbi:MAG: hypothetical protein IS860_05195 [Nitrosopumilus sp.]|nr:hypothetical protein [Nitrosopumilus sp.]
MPSIQKWCKIAEEHSKKSRSYRAYYNGMGDRKSVISAYAYGMSRFMKFLKDNNDVSNVENFDKLLSFSTKKITAVLRDYVFYLNSHVKGVSVRTYLNGPNLFFTMNDKIWNDKLTKKSIHGDDGSELLGIMVTKTGSQSYYVKHDKVTSNFSGLSWDFP